MRYILNLLILLLSCIAFGQGETIVNGEIGAKVDQAFTEEAKNHFGGAVLIVKDGKVLLSKGYGAP
jgi:CubicO group peptidase (beta-lactamase class C family)